MATDSALLRCRSCSTLNRVPVRRLSHNPICGRCKTLLDFPFLPVSVTGASLDQEISTWLETVLIEFWTKDCALCRTVDPSVSDIAFSRAGKLKVLKVDVEAEAGLADLYSVQATPTFITFRNGRQLARLDGAPRESSELMKWVDESMQ